MNKVLNKGPLLAAFTFTLLFMLLAAFYDSSVLRQYDNLLIKMVSRFEVPLLDHAFILISDSASRPAEFSVLILFSIWCVTVKKRVAEPLLLTGALISVRYVNSWLKDVYERDRPEFRHIIEAPGYSFPSGHAMISMAFFFLLVIVLMKMTNLKGRIAAACLALTAFFVFLVGLSRVYLGVHYPSDVIAGFMAGIVWLLLWLFVYKLLLMRENGG